MTIDRSAEILAELPPGAIDRLTAALGRGRRAAGASTLHGAALRAEAVRHLLLPVTVDPAWPHPTPPEVVGAGAVHADLIDDDRDTFSRLRTTLDDDARTDAETVAAQAQSWRLPVTPYRRPDDPAARLLRRAAHEAAAVVAPAGGHPDGPPPATGRRGPAPSPSRRPGDTPVVIDLTALWAGPLATALLAEHGAAVIKVDAEVRPDGLRARPAVYDALNRAKRIVDLDLRRDGDRQRFDELLAQADLLIDSFSRRVLPNLGYGPAVLAERFPDLVSIGITAFPPDCPEADWVAYGPGVHAAIGAARTVEGRWRPAPIAYPDALAGGEAFAVAAAALDRPVPGRRFEVSLAAAVAPLVADGGPGTAPPVVERSAPSPGPVVTS
ncbi:MAG: CoA transferase [Actinomycetota bacterium]